MEMQKIKKYAVVGAICLMFGVLLLAFVEPVLAQGAAGGEKAAYESFAGQAEDANTHGWRAGRGMSI